MKKRRRRRRYQPPGVVAPSTSEPNDRWGRISKGTCRFEHCLRFIANALKQHPIGLEEVDDGLWSMHFCGVLLARLDERAYIIRP